MEHLDEFVTVVEQRSLNKAAQLLNISQPALSRKIMNLEEKLGILLFERKGKKLEITTLGQIVYDHALEMLRLKRKLMYALEQFKGVDKPRAITIGASLTTLQATLPELITLFTQDYPETEIKAITGKTHEVVSLVKDRKVDLGLVASKIETPGMTCVPLFDDHLCLVLPRGSGLVDRQLEISDLNGLPMILFSRGTWYRVLMDELFHRYAIYPDVRMEIDSFEAILRLVATCNNATLLPKSYLRHNLMEESELIVREIAELEQTKRTTTLLFTEETANLSAVKLFVSRAEQYFAKQGG
jgi:DNA-binding transcriptional LysR family regulator